MKPKDVNEKNEVAVLFRLFDGGKCITDKRKFKKGDKVRISKHKHLFEKGYTPNWTTEVFTIDKVKPAFPYTYELKDYQDQSIAGGFNEHELEKAANPDVFLIEKILKKRGNKLYVKWLGFDNSHNSWISKSDL